MRSRGRRPPHRPTCQSPALFSTQLASLGGLTKTEIHRSWSTALVLLEAASVTGVLAPAAADFVASHKSQLERPHEPFARTGKVLVPAAATTTKQLVQAVADRFDVDDAVAQRAVETATRGQQYLDTKGKRKEETELSPDEWDRATAWVFEERMAVIGVVALLLRTRASRSFSVMPHSHAAN